MTSTRFTITLLLLASLMACSRDRSTDATRSAAPQRTGSMAKPQSNTAALRPRRLAPRPGRARLPLIHPRARFQREFKLGNQTHVRYAILVEGPEDQVAFKLRFDFSRHHKRALRAHGWSLVKRTSAYEGPIEDYLHKNGSRLQLNIHGMSNVRPKGRWVTHDYLVTFIFPKGLAPSAVLGARYKN